MNAIKIENLVKNYGNSRGIIDVNLEVKEGEFFGFIGPNGAGKSTTIRTLLGLLNPTSGKASIFDLDIVKEKTKILSLIGYLPSESSFYNGMKVKDIIKLSADLRKANCEETAKELCERLQLDVNKKVEELSFGNRKKVGIVCALQSNPKLLILDEPTSGLDPLMQVEFYSILKERNKKGTTIFLSSHILSEIQKYCTKAAIIREGRLIKCDSVENMAKTKTRRVTIHGDFDVSNLANVKDIQKKEDSISFLYNDDINSLLKKLSNTKIDDLTITEPDLEEIFMHYYQKGEENDNN